MVGTATAWPRGSPPGCLPWASTRCSLNSNKDQTVLLLSFHSRAWTDQRCPAKCMEAHVEYSTFCRLSSMTTGYKRQGQSPPERPDLGDTPAPTLQVTARRPGEPSPPRSGRGPRGGRQVGPRPPRPRAKPRGLWARVSALRTGAAGTSRPGESDAQRGGPRAAEVLPSPPRPGPSEVGDKWAAPRGGARPAPGGERERERGGAGRGDSQLPPPPAWPRRGRRALGGAPGAGRGGTRGGGPAARAAAPSLPGAEPRRPQRRLGDSPGREPAAPWARRCGREGRAARGGAGRGRGPLRAHAPAPPAAAGSPRGARRTRARLPLPAPRHGARNLPLPGSRGSLASSRFLSVLPLPPILLPPLDFATRASAETTSK